MSASRHNKTVVLFTTIVIQCSVNLSSGFVLSHGSLNKAYASEGCFIIFLSTFVGIIRVKIEDKIKSRGLEDGYSGHVRPVQNTLMSVVTVA